MAWRSLLPRIDGPIATSLMLGASDDGSVFSPSRAKMERVADYEPDPSPPTSWERFSRKFKQEPLIPIGVGLTTFALLGAARSMRRGDSKTFNVWLRARVAAQGLTVLAAIGGSVIYAKERAAERLEWEKEREERKRIDEAAGGREARELNERVERMRVQERFAASQTRPTAQSEEETAGGFVKGSIGAGASEEEKRARKEEQDKKRAWIRKKMAESAKEEGRALRMPTSADFDPPASSQGEEKGGSSRLV